MLKTIIKYTNDVQITIIGNVLNISGKFGVLTYLNVPSINIIQEQIDISENYLILTATKTIRNKSLIGTAQVLIKNMIVGVSRGHVARLELIGVGYKVNIINKQIILNLGYSHPITLDIPKHLTVHCPETTSIIIFGINKQEVSHFAVKLKRLRKPEPYKGKGIRYFNEKVVLKAGKKK